MEIIGWLFMTAPFLAIPAFFIYMEGWRRGLEATVFACGITGLVLLSFWAGAQLIGGSP